MLGVSPAPQRAAKPKSVSRMRGGCAVSSSALSSFRSRCAMWCRWQNATVLMNCLKKKRALDCAQASRASARRQNQRCVAYARCTRQTELTGP